MLLVHISKQVDNGDNFFFRCQGAGHLQLFAGEPIGACVLHHVKLWARSS